MTNIAIDDALLKLRRGQAAAVELEVTASSIAELMEGVDKRLFGKLLRGEVISPEEAHQAWIEKYSYYRLTKKLVKTERIGRGAAAQTAAPEFDLTRTPSV